MGESNNQQLRQINSQLIELYLILYQPSINANVEQSIRSKIISLETEKARLPNIVLHNDKLQQYIVILRSAASSLGYNRIGFNDEDTCSLQQLITQSAEVVL